MDELSDFIFENNWRNYPWWMNFPKMFALFQSFVSPFYIDLQDDIKMILNNTFVNARSFPKFSKDRLSNGIATFWIFDKTGMSIYLYTYFIVIRLQNAENLSIVQRHSNGELLLPLAPLPEFNDAIACLWRFYDGFYQEICGKYFKSLRNIENEEEILKIQFYCIILSKCQPHLQNQQCQDGRKNSFVYPMELGFDKYKWGAYFYLFSLLNHSVLAYKVCYSLIINHRVLMRKISS